MTDDTTAGTGGRLPLIGPYGLTPEQQQAYDFVAANFVPWADQAGFCASDADGHLIGPFSSVLYSPAISEAFLEWQVAEQAHTSLDRRTREVVILSVGAVWRSDYELYAHAAVAGGIGLSAATIAALRAGAEPDGLSAGEMVAHRVARQLTLDRRVDPALFEAARAALGGKGLVDLVHLVGAYQTVCGILNAFIIPAPKE